MAFTFSVGGAIGTFSQNYEDIVSIYATAAMGSYAQLQVQSIDFALNIMDFLRKITD